MYEIISEETMRDEKFKRLAEARTNKALKQIKLIGNLSNKSSYKYNQDEVAVIFGALEAELGKARSRFENAGHVDKATEFRFS